MLRKFSWKHFACISFHFTITVINYWASFTRKKLVSYSFSTSWHDMKFKLKLGIPLGKDVDRQRHQLNHMALPKKSFWSINDISGTWPQWWCHVLSPFIKDYHWSKFQLHSIRVINSFFSNIDDYSDSNEKTKCLKT